MPTLGDQIAAYAQQQLGKPYVFGAEGPNSFDCSGLVYAAYKAAGLSVNRVNAATLGRQGMAVDQAHAVPGDVVYYDEAGSIDHVGIYIGNGQMVDAPTQGKPVERVSIGHPTSIRHLAPIGDPSTEPLPQSTGTGGGIGGIFDTVSDAVSSLNPFGAWQSDAVGIGLKIMAAGIAGTLVIVGAWEALHDKDQK